MYYLNTNIPKVEPSLFRVCLLSQAGAIQAGPGLTVSPLGKAQGCGKQSFFVSLTP